jgi:ABC-type Mn2+/Zn2+ transport system ATPase subunit
VSRDVLAELRDVTAAYGGPPAIEDVSFALREGQRIGVLGPNGGGKTTLFKVMLGLLQPRSGGIELASRCGYVPQNDRSRLDYPVSALDVVLMGALGRLPWWRRPGRTERGRAMSELELVGLEQHAQTSYGELSGGQRQRVLIARALIGEARLLLMDEPFAGVDASSAGRVMTIIDRLAEQGKGVMIATHDVEQVRAWDLVLCLNRHQVAFGPPESTLTRRVLEETHGGALFRLPGAGADEPEAALVPPHHHEHGS